MMLKTFLLTIFFLTNTYALSNLEVAQKSEEVMSGFEDSVSLMRMELINANAQKKVRTMKMKVLEGKDEDKSLMEFLTPADVKGTKFLNYEHITKDDDQWLYLPALRRVKRIASKNKSGAFMGSEFAYEDLSGFNAKKYIYNSDAQEVVVDSKEMYKVTSKPLSKYSGYTKLISWCDKDIFLIRKIQYYDRKGELLKVATFSEYKKFGNVYRIGKIVMKNVQNDKTTILTWEDEKIKNHLREKDFNKRYLKR
jgi:hypothetical protein